MTTGILQNKIWDDNLYHAGYKPDTIDILKDIAFINVKKVGGASRAKVDELREAYSKTKDLLFKQIEIVKPEVVIFGGSYFLFKNDWPCTMQSFGTCDAGVEESKIMIDAYHPAYFTISQQQHFEDILRAYKDCINKV